MKLRIINSKIYRVSMAMDFGTGHYLFYCLSSSPPGLSLIRGGEWPGDEATQGYSLHSSECYVYWLINTIVYFVKKNSFHNFIAAFGCQQNFEFCCRSKQLLLMRKN